MKLDGFGPLARFAGEVSGCQAHLRCDNSASMKQQRAGVISAKSVLKIGPESCTCSSHSEVMSASPSAYVGVGLQGNECDWLYYFQYFLPFFTLHAYCMLCFFNFVIFVFTSPLVAARDSGLFVNAVQPGGPAEGKVSKSSCLWSSSSRFPSSIFNHPISQALSLSTTPHRYKLLTSSSRLTAESLQA